jgi:hypothetical protein
MRRVEAERDCILCQIIAGDSPSTTIARNERAVAFMDINPTTPGHALVIPRSHATDLLDVDGDFHLHVILRFKDDIGKDRIGLPWATVPSNLDEVQRFGALLV